MARSERTIQQVRQAVNNEINAGIKVARNIGLGFESLRSDLSRKDIRLSGIQDVLSGAQVEHVRQFEQGSREEGRQDARDWLGGKSGTETAGILKNLRGR